jgi:nucleotide-binding universal stress UspA family protein
MPGIVVGVDGSGHSQRALEWAMKEAAVRGAPLTVMSVHQVLKGYFGGTVEYPHDPALAEKARQQVQAEVDETLDKLGAQRPETVTVRTVSGSVVEELVAAGKDADLLVVGSRGAGGFTRLVMGSVSSLVIQHATCPVVIIPPEGRE